VMIVASAPYLLSVNPKLPVRDAKEFVAHAKAQPGRLSYSSCDNGTVCHLSGEQFKKANGVHIVHIPYRGSAPAITAVAAGEVEVAFDTVTAQVAQARAGRIRPLVVSGTRRSETLPDVPSASEVGLPAFDADSWFGIVVPAGTARDITQRLAEALKQIAATPEVRATFARQGLDTLSGTPAQFAEQIRRDQAKWGSIVKFSGARLD
jgi:tripartite-type tricarboxylate transporter receptor subunit TctC